MAPSRKGRWEGRWLGCGGCGGAGRCWLRFAAFRADGRCPCCADRQFLDTVVDLPVVAMTGAVLGHGGDMPVVATTGAVLGHGR